MLMFLCAFLLYFNDLPANAICNIAIYDDDATLYSNCNWASDFWQQLKLFSKCESDLCDAAGWAKK